MFNNQEQLSFYRKMAELQEKLRKSEEERAGLEAKFQSFVKSGRAADHARHVALRQKYLKFLEEDKKRKTRNERILAALDKIEQHTNTLTAKTERLRLLRRHFDAYMARTYPEWKEHIKVSTGSLHQTVQQTTQPKTFIGTPSFIPTQTKHTESLTKEADHFKSLMKEKFQLSSPLDLKHSFLQPERQFSEIDPQTDINTSRDLLSMSLNDDYNISEEKKDHNKKPQSLEDEEIIIKKLTRISSFEDEKETTPISDRPRSTLGHRLSSFEDEKEIPRIVDRPGTSMGHRVSSFEDEKEIPRHADRPGTSMGHRVPIPNTLEHPISYINIEPIHPVEFNTEEFPEHDDFEHPYTSSNRVTEYPKVSHPVKDYRNLGRPEFVSNEFIPEMEGPNVISNEFVSEMEQDRITPEPLYKHDTQDLAYHHSNILRPYPHHLNYIHQEDNRTQEPIRDDIPEKDVSSKQDLECPTIQETFDKEEDEPEKHESETSDRTNISYGKSESHYSDFDHSKSEHFEGEKQQETKFESNYLEEVDDGTIMEEEPGQIEDENREYEEHYKQQRPSEYYDNRNSTNEKKYQEIDAKQEFVPNQKPSYVVRNDDPIPLMQVEQSLPQDVIKEYYTKQLQQNSLEKPQVQHPQYSEAHPVERIISEPQEYQQYPEDSSQMQQHFSTEYHSYAEQNPKGYAEKPQEYAERFQEYIEEPREYAEKSQEYADESQEYAERSQEYAEISRGERNHEYTEKHQEYAERPQEYAKTPQEYAERPQEYAERFQEYAERPQKYTERPQEYTERSQEYVERLQEYTEKPQEYTEGPQEYTDRSKEYTERPKDYTERPLEYEERPQEYIENSQEHAEYSKARIKPTEEDYIQYSDQQEYPENITHEYQQQYTEQKRSQEYHELGTISEQQYKQYSQSENLSRQHHEQIIPEEYPQSEEYVRQEYDSKPQPEYHEQYTADHKQDRPDYRDYSQEQNPQLYQEQGENYEDSQQKHEEYQPYGETNSQNYIEQISDQQYSEQNPHSYQGVEYYKDEQEEPYREQIIQSEQNVPKSSQIPIEGMYGGVESSEEITDMQAGGAGFKDMELQPQHNIVEPDTDTLAELDSSDMTATISETKLHSEVLSTSEISSEDTVERQVAALVQQPPATAPKTHTSPQQHTPKSLSSNSSKPSSRAPIRSDSRPSSASSRSKPPSPAAKAGARFASAAKKK